MWDNPNFLPKEMNEIAWVDFYFQEMYVPLWNRNS